MAAPLLIGSNILNLSAWDLETYTNVEVGRCVVLSMCSTVIARVYCIHVLVFRATIALHHSRSPPLHTRINAQVIAIDQDPLGVQGTPSHLFRLARSKPQPHTHAMCLMRYT